MTCEFIARLAHASKAVLASLTVAAVLNVASVKAGENICPSGSRAKPPKADMPTVADHARLRGCNSESLYYGMGVPVNLTDARLCAFIEVEQGVDGLPLQGNGMLMMVYANGSAVERSPTLAKSYACTLGWDSRELGSLMQHIDSVLNSGGSLDACDVVPG